MDLESELVATATQSPEEFGNFRKYIDPAWIEEALAATGTATLRRRRLPAEQVVWLVIGMALYRDLPIADVVRSLELALPSTKGKSVAPSAIPQARERLGEEPMKWLFGKTGEAWADRSADEHRYRGLALYGVDGTTMKVPDTPDNRIHFGGPTTSRGASGYPLLRLTVLMSLRSHLLRAAEFGPYRMSETELAVDMWKDVPDDSLTIVDRGFFGAPTLIPLAADGENRHWMSRAKKNLKSETVERLGRGDEIVEMKVSSSARKANSSLPRTWRVRAIRYQRKGYRPGILLTSLLDPVAYPASELTALYHERWELEIGYDEIKTHLLDRRETIRSQSARNVWQEMWGILLGYNLVRLEMERLASMADVPPTRISFITTLRELRVAFHMWQFASPGALPKRIRDWEEDTLRFVLPERRTHRSYPRAVKVKMSNYKRNRPKVSPTGNDLN